jgi:hypothetical protein
VRTIQFDITGEVMCAKTIEYFRFCGPFFATLDPNRIKNVNIHFLTDDIDDLAVVDWLRAG